MLRDEDADESRPLLTDGQPGDATVVTAHLQQHSSNILESHTNDMTERQFEDGEEKHVAYEILTASGSHIVIHSGETAPVDVVGATTT